MPARSRLKPQPSAAPSGLVTPSTLSGEDSDLNTSRLERTPARSRIKHRSQNPLRLRWHTSTHLQTLQSAPQPIATVFQQARHWSAKNSELIETYVHQLYLVILSTGGYAATLYILLTVQPEEISHIPFPYWYGPLQLAFFLGNICFFSFIFLHIRRGILSAVFLSLILFMQLQSVRLTTELIGGLLALFVCVELLCFLVTKKQRR
jgi:hypothetical protein